MVRAQLAKEDVECNGASTLIGEFLDQPAIDLTRPIEAELVAQ